MVKLLSFALLCLTAVEARPTTSPARSVLLRRDDSELAPVAAVNLDRTGWTVTANSAQAGNAASNVLDGDKNTIWHSQYNPNVALPHALTIDMKSTFVVSGVGYLPRQDGGKNGNIGRHTIELSTDNSQWTLVAKGTFLDDQTEKRTFFASMPARYVRITAKSEADERGPWTSVAEINVLSLPSSRKAVSRAGWSVSASSAQSNPSNLASNAIDGNAESLWHTQYDVTPIPAHPHSFTIDRGTGAGSISIAGLSYLPRPANTGGNGRIGKFRVESSTDNQNWTPLVSGSWSDDANLKATNFASTTARYIRLVALSEAGGRGPWTSAAEINLLDAAPQFTPLPKNKGQWSPTINFPLVPAAAAVLYDGKVLTWSAYSPSRFDGGGPAQTVTSAYDPVTDIVDQKVISDTKHDMFCPGISLDFDGNPFVTGGNSSPKTSIYDVAGAKWKAGADMKKSRGYQSSATLSDGRIFEIGGSWSGGNGGKIGEAWNPSTNTWTELPNCDVTKMLTDDKQDKNLGYTYRADNHAWLFGWKKGYVFQAGPSKQMNWYGTSGQGSTKSAGNRASDPHSMNGNAVMYDAVAGKILTMGGAPDYQDSDATALTHVITIGEPDTNPTVKKVADMAYRRSFANAVSLPDGTVFVVGGQTWPVPFSDKTSIMYPEIWDPSTEKWTTMNPHSIPRNYHSVAILLPDATVFTGGGGLCYNCIESTPVNNHYNAQVFTPPYLYNAIGGLATRPKINNVSATTVKVGAQFTVTTDSAISKWSLVRFGSATHTVNTDQRRIPLTASGSGNSYMLTIPSDPGVALPGYWMLFAMNSAGVPSVAKSIKITL